jgi:hypothetical protein
MFKKYKEKRAKVVIPDGLVSKKSQKGELFMVVIGESPNKLHWSAYGCRWGSSSSAIWV